MTSGRQAERPGGEERILTLPGRFRAVVFDLDGLLLDTEPGWRRAEAELLRRHGAVYTRADEEASLGTTVHDVVDRYADRLGLNGEARHRLLAELLELAGAEYAGPIPIRAGATEVLAALRGRVPLGVASNTPRELVIVALESTGLRDCFDAVVTADDVSRPKPAPDVYLEACRRLAVDPRGAVALEDSPTGVAAAMAAGLAVIGVPESPGVDLPGADHVVGSLQDLLPLESR
ncbi:MAG TPA: HAD family phosphatase [Candidatus Limnocylindria bacterium]